MTLLAYGQTALSWRGSAGSPVQPKCRRPCDGSPVGSSAPHGGCCLSGEIRLPKAGFEEARAAAQEWLSQLSPEPFTPDEQVALIALGEQLDWSVKWGRDLAWHTERKDLIGQERWLALAKAGPWQQAHAVLQDAEAEIHRLGAGRVRRPPFNVVRAESEIRAARTRLFASTPRAYADAVWADIELLASAALVARSPAALAWVLREAESASKLGMLDALERDEGEDASSTRAILPASTRSPGRPAADEDSRVARQLVEGVLTAESLKSPSVSWETLASDSRVAMPERQLRDWRRYVGEARKALSPGDADNVDALTQVAQAIAHQEREERRKRRKTPR